jgi:RNA polymerase sigma factor (sigma-70 family)
MEDVDPPLRQLAAEMAWMRRLARALLRDGDAEDLAQDAWIVASERAPSEGPTRPWLARVMLNLARMRGRSRMRREAREEKTAELVQAEPRPDDLVERVEMQQLVASYVLALAEPYRSTVLLHFFEELSCAEIVRKLEIPEGTVRRRLKVALDELRARIGANDRSGRGLLALAPLAAAPTSNPLPVAIGVFAMKKLVAGIVVVILLLVAGVWWKWRGSSSESSSTVATAQKGSASANAISAHDSAVVESDGVPAWLAQADVKARHVAGRVVFRGAPVAGASVELASVASESGLVAAPRRVTNAAGEFDFGAQRAMPWSVRASAPGKASARLDVDLRDPRATPDKLELGSCTAAMVGIVRDASGGPIANARVAPLADNLVHGGPGSDSSVPGGPAAKTDDKGAYELCLETRWPGWVAVEVSADSYAAITFVTVAPGRISVDFALVPEAAITGRVIRDDDGSPVAHAYVFVPPGHRGVESTPLRGAFTDERGVFRLDGMSAGRHLVFARADGLADTSRATPVVVGVGQTSVEIELRLEAASTIAGRVVSSNKPIAGARVMALDTAGRPGPSAISQEDGAFVLANVPRDDTRFVARPYDVVSPKTFAVTQARHEGVTLEVESLGRIVGTVVRAKKPVPGALLYISGPNETELEPVRADATGHFEARGLQPGPWILYADNDRGGAFGRAPETIQLARGQTAEVTIDLAYAASIAGRVVDQTGSPVAGVTVQFRNVASEDAGIAATATDGTFRATKMTGGGKYITSVRRNQMARAPLRPATGTEHPTITLTDGDSEVTGIVLAVQIDHLSIAGKVVDADGAPVPDARVVAQLVDDTDALFDGGFQDPADTTNVDGRFSIGDLHGGSYSVRARSPEGVEVTLAGIRAGRSDVVFTLPASGSIEVTTVGFKTAPQVTALRSGAQLFAAPTVAVANGTSYSLRSLSPGSYVVTARTQSEAASSIVEVAAGKPSHITLTSGGSGVIAGHVREFGTGKGIEGMTCRVLPRVGTESTEVSAREGVRTDAQGAFLLASAPAGSIAVSCDGLWRSYSDGLRLLTLQPSQRVDIDVPVVRWSQEPGMTRGNLGADLDARMLVPRLVRVAPKGPAGLAGIRDGDVIVTVDGRSVTELSPDGAHGLVINRSPGTKVPIGLSRGATTVTVEVTLGEAQR